MPSSKYYMAMKVVDLRRELASRNLPTEGLKQDLAFRLASLDNARVSTALKLSHPTCIPASATSNEDTVTKMENDDELITSVRNKSPERVTPSSQNKLSSPFVRENCQGDKNRRVSNLARMLIAFGTALLLILLITFLSWVLWHYIPTTDKEYLSIILDDVYHFLTSHVNNCQTFLRSQFQNGHHFISRKIQPMVVALMKQISSRFIEPCLDGKAPTRVVTKVVEVTQEDNVQESAFSSIWSSCFHSSKVR